MSKTQQIPLKTPVEFEYVRKEVKEKEELPIYYSTMIIGPSGSGKSTCCNGLGQFFETIDRKYITINLDPANDLLNYKCDIDIRDLIQLEDVMEEFKLGPNGGLLYCMDFLEKNIDWLIEEILKHKNCYLLFDLPGQIELYLNSESMKKIVEHLKFSEKLNVDIVLCELFDSHYCYDKNLFLSVCLQALTSLMNLELPHINILSKIDLMSQMGRPDLDLENYLTFENISQIYYGQDQNQKSKFDKKHSKLNQQIFELIDDQGLLNFQPLDINNKILVSNLISILDKANGYCYSQNRKTEKLDQIRADIAKTNNVYALQGFQDLQSQLFQEDNDPEFQEFKEKQKNKKLDTDEIFSAFDKEVKEIIEGKEEKQNKNQQEKQENQEKQNNNTQNKKQKSKQSGFKKGFLL